MPPIKKQIKDAHLFYAKERRDEGFSYEYIAHEVSMLRGCKASGISAKERRQRMVSRHIIKRALEAAGL